MPSLRSRTSGRNAGRRLAGAVPSTAVKQSKNSAKLAAGVAFTLVLTFSLLTVFRYHYGVMRLSIELDREDDGQWIAEVPELPGVMAYGSSRDEAIESVERLAAEVIADRVAHGELADSRFTFD